MSEQFNKTVENATIGGKTKKDTRDFERRQRDIRDSGKAYAVKKGMQIAVIFLLVLTFALMLWNFHQSAEISALKMTIGGIEKYSDSNLVKKTDGLVSRVSHIEEELGIITPSEDGHTAIFWNRELSDGTRTIDKISVLEEESEKNLMEKIVEKYFPNSKILSIREGATFKGLFCKEGTDKKLIGYEHGEKEFNKTGMVVRILTDYVYLNDSLILTKEKEPSIKNMVDVKITLLDKDNTKKYIFFVSPDDYPEIKTSTSDTKVEK